MGGKRVAVCSHMVPFTTGGIELHATSLVDALNRAGHRAEWIRIPFSFGPVDRVVPSALTWRFIDLKDITGTPPDVAICLSFPSYLVEHPNKIVWLCHQHRAAYELFGTPRSNFADDDQGRYFRSVIQRLDTQTFGEVKRFFANSQNVANRLLASHGYRAEVLWVPPVNTVAPGPTSWEPFILHVGRLTSLKRPELVVEALAHAPDARVVFAGKGDVEEALQALARDLGVAERVTFAGFVDAASLSDYYRRCSGVVFTPFDEDFGLVPGEAFLARKPVITCTDSGGGRELVEDGVTGYVVEPTATTIADAMTRLLSDGKAARQMGEAGHARMAGVTWPEVVRRLEAVF